MSYDEILELGQPEHNMLYYYPGFKVCHLLSHCIHKLQENPEPFFHKVNIVTIFQVESLNKLMQKINEDLIKTSKHDLSHEFMHSTIEV